MFCLVYLQGCLQRGFLGFFHLTLHIIPGFLMFPYFQNFFKNTSIGGGVNCSSLGRRKDVLLTGRWSVGLSRLNSRVAK